MAKDLIIDLDMSRLRSYFKVYRIKVGYNEVVGS